MSGWPDSIHLTGHISRPPVEVGTRHIRANYQETFGFEIGEFGPAEIELVLHDSEVISSLLRNHPTEMTEVINHALTGRTEAAVRLASQIGLTEEAFLQRGGGPFFWVAIAFVAGMILALAATTPPKQAPTPGEGVGDAGGGGGAGGGGPPPPPPE